MAPRIEIVPAREEWTSDFVDLRRQIIAVAPGGSYAHHIGSTAVPGLSAKDVIDIQLTVKNLELVDVASIEKVGFRQIVGLVDHPPAGVFLNNVELRKLFFRGTGRATNLHIREQGRFNQRYALLCRDYLRARPAVSRAYELIKLRLASRFPNDGDAYYEIKDPVFDIIVAGASDWSALTNWSEPPPD
ncbi:MAG: GrpB family protein [Bradyrhizobium sp.]|nr:GrpB family protein [Bradyrhizobium sp.]